MNKIITFIDTNNLNLDYSDYVDYCVANEITPSTENSDDYWKWYSNERYFLVEDILTNLNNTKIEDPVIITGTLGFWNGTKEIYPMLVESEDYDCTNHRFSQTSLYRAISKCINGMDDFKIELANGDFIVTGYHHDGTNKLTISKLSKKGIVSATRANESGSRLSPKPYWFGKIRESDLER